MTSQEGYRKFGLDFFFNLLSTPDSCEKRFCQPVMEETSAPEAQGQKHSMSGQNTVVHTEQAPAQTQGRPWQKRD